MKNVHAFSTAGRIMFGVNAIDEVGNAVKSFKATNVLVLCDPGIKKIGVFDRVVNALKDSELNVYKYTDIIPEPPDTLVDECAAMFQDKGIECLVSVGGGSSLDFTKVIATILKYGGKTTDYLGENKIPGRVLPHIAIPTTSGTGSEVSPLALILDTAKNMKIGASDNYLLPDVALVDPSLTIGLPPKITAMTGADALCHAIESYTSKPYYCFPDNRPVQFHGSSEITDAVALASIKLAGKSLRAAVLQGENMEARTNMSYCSLLAGMAFTNSGTGVAHAIATALGAITHAPHGIVAGLMLPYALEFNAPLNIEKCKEIAVALGKDVSGLSPMEAALKSVEAVFDIYKDINMPIKLRDIGLTENQIEKVVEDTMVITRILRINPRVCGENEIREIVKKAF